MRGADFERARVADPDQVEEPIAIAGSGTGEGLSGGGSQGRGFVRDVDGDEHPWVFLFEVGFVQTSVDLLPGVGDCLRISEISSHSPIP